MVVILGSQFELLCALLEILYSTGGSLIHIAIHGIMRIGFLKQLMGIN